MTDFSVQVIPYTGDGVDDRLVATTADLTQGAVAVWIFPNTTYESSFRYTTQGLVDGAAMTGTKVVFAGVSTTKGITGFQSGGFTVADDNPVNCHVNTLSATYVALVFQDTSIDHHFLQVGTYVGQGDVSFQIDTAVGAALIVSQGNQFTANLVGTQMTFGGESHVLGSVLSASHAVMSDPALATYTLVPTTFTQDNRLIFSRVPLTHLWIMGVNLCYCDSTFTAGDAIDFAHVTSTFTNKVRQLVASETAAGSAFKLGTDSIVNSPTKTYFWMGFQFTAAELADNAFFRSFLVANSGNPVNVTGLGFTPSYAVARHLTTEQYGAIWRGPTQAGTNSVRMSDILTRTSSGITAMGAVTNLTLDTDLTSGVGSSIVGYALPSSGGIPAVGCTAVTVRTARDVEVPLQLPSCGSCAVPVFAIVTSPAHGALVGTLPAVIYVPTAGYTGSDSFVYSSHCGGTPAQTTVSITITADQGLQGLGAGCAA